MPRLFVLSGPDVGKSVTIDGDVDLGRSPDVAVVLRSASISRRHAQIVLQGGRWWLVDLGSINGTTIGGRRIQREELADGVLFHLGEIELRFRLDEARPSRGPGAQEPTTVLEADEGGAPVDGGAAIELEGDWDDSVPAPARSGGPPAARSAPTPTRPAGGGASGRAGARAGAHQRAALEATEVRRGARTTTSGGRVLQYKKVAERGGFLSADLGQYPFWVRATVVLFALALFVALAYAAFRMTAGVRERMRADVSVEARD